MALIARSGNGQGAQPDASLIIPVFNRGEATRDLIEALQADRSRAAFEVIAVDCGSSDGVAGWLTAQSAIVQLPAPGQTLSFAKAVNLAAQQARGANLVLLHNDTLPEPGWLDALMEAVRSDAGIAVAGGKLLFPETRTVQHAGLAVDSEGRIRHIYEHFTGDHPAVNKPRDFQAVSAALMLIRMVIFREFGGFNERFVNGLEEVDFCLRVRERGWRVVYEPRAVALHDTEPSRVEREFARQNHQALSEIWRGKLTADCDKFYREDGFICRRGSRGEFLEPEGKDMQAMAGEARAALKEGNYEQALARYGELDRLYPVDVNTIHYLALLHERRRAWTEAARLLKRLAALEPSAGVWTRLAQACLKMKDYERAGEYAARALGATGYNSPIAAEALAIMGDAAFKSGRTGEAVTHYQAAAAIDGEQGRALTGLGTVELARQNYLAALPIFERLAARHPGHLRAALGRGLCSLGLRDMGEAAKWLTAALELDPENSGALAAALPLLSDAGKLEQAHQLLERYLQIYPDDHALALAQAGVSFRLGYYDRCRALVATIKDRHSDYPGVAELERELERALSPTPRAVAAPAFA